MVAVNLWASLSRFTDGARVVEVQGATIAEALKALVAAHPGLGPVVAGGVSVVVDGEIVPNRHTAVAPDAEIFLLQQIKGG
jgi:molybdopterin synthase sulfur carrier subunit